MSPLLTFSNSIRCIKCRKVNRRCVPNSEYDDTCKYCKKNEFQCIRIKPMHYESEIFRLSTELDDLKTRVTLLEKDNRLIKRNLLQRKLLDEELNDII
jgi:hypothetical protein